MIVEFYGLEGCGKSTVARKIEKNTDFKVIKIKKRSELLFYNFLFLIKHPIKFFGLFFYILKNSKFFYLKFMNSFLHHNAKNQKALGTKNAIIDQGHFQNIISVFDKKIKREELIRYLKFLPRPNKLVIFKLNNELRERRLEERKYTSRGKSKKWKETSIENNKIFVKNIDKISQDYLVVENVNLEETVSFIKSKING